MVKSAVSAVEEDLHRLHEKQRAVGDAER